MRRIFHTKSVKANVYANAIGNIWNGLMNFIFIPIYIKFIGVEGYGVVGIYTTLLSVLSLLDLGIGASANRELARYSALKNKNQEIADLVKSLELVYWVISFTALIVLFLFSDFIARFWVKPEELTSGQLKYCFYLIAVALFFRLPLSFYSGCMAGLQVQVALNLVNIVGVSFRTIGAVLVLKYVSSDIVTFFYWQVVASIIHTILAALLLTQFMPRGVRGYFRRDIIMSIKKFAFGMSAISVTAIVLNQLDKVILTKVLSLEEFGYYSFAFSVCSTLSLVANMLPQALFPRFSQMAAIHDGAGLRRVYRDGYVFMASAILPIAVVVFYFAPELLHVWTSDKSLVTKTAPIVRGLIIAQTLLSLMPLPYMITLAFGNTKIVLRINIIAILVLAPLFYLFTKWFGVLGPIWGWLILAVSYILIAIPFIHKKFIPGETIQFYMRSFGVPLIFPVLIMGLFRLLNFESYTPAIVVSIIGVGFLITCAAIVFATPGIKSRFSKAMVW